MSKIDLNKAGILAGFSILLLLLILIGVVLVFTVVFWLPIVLFNIPFIIIFGILAKYTIVYQKNLILIKKILFLIILGRQTI